MENLLVECFDLLKLIAQAERPESFVSALTYKSDVLEAIPSWRLKSFCDSFEWAGAPLLAVLARSGNGTDEPPFRIGKKIKGPARVLLVDDF
jgi:hypothetical protein